MQALDIIEGDELPGLGRVVDVAHRPGWTRLFVGGKTFDVPNELVVHVDRKAVEKEVPSSKQHIPTRVVKPVGQSPIPRTNPFAAETQTATAAPSAASEPSSVNGDGTEPSPATSVPTL